MSKLFPYGIIVAPALLLAVAGFAHEMQLGEKVAATEDAVMRPDCGPTLYVEMQLNGHTYWEPVKNVPGAEQGVDISIHTRGEGFSSNVGDRHGYSSASFTSEQVGTRHNPYD